MRSRILVGTLLIVGVLAVGTVATTGDGVAPPLQWAIVNLPDPTAIGPEGTLVMGPVLITHDDMKMARGEPCTSVYRFKPGSGPKEELVSFQCKPDRRKAAEKVTLTTRRDYERGILVLTEYQFAGDAEVHGVPCKR
jgi:hypothetical protein